MSYYNRRRYRPRENSRRIPVPTDIPVGSIIYKRPQEGGFTMAVYRYLGIKNNSHVLVRLIDINLGSYSAPYFHYERTRLPRVPDSTAYMMHENEPLDVFNINLSTPRKNLNAGVKITLASIEKYSPIINFRDYFSHIYLYLTDYIALDSRPLSIDELSRIKILYSSFLNPILEKAYAEIKQKHLNPFPQVSSPSIFL